MGYHGRISLRVFGMPFICACSDRLGSRSLDWRDGRFCMSMEACGETTKNHFGPIGHSNNWTWELQCQRFVDAKGMQLRELLLIECIREIVREIGSSVGCIVWQGLLLSGFNSLRIGRGLRLLTEPPPYPTYLSRVHPS